MSQAARLNQDSQSGPDMGGPSNRNPHITGIYPRTTEGILLRGKVVNIPSSITAYTIGHHSNNLSPVGVARAM